MSTYGGPCRQLAGRHIALELAADGPTPAALGRFMTVEVPDETSRLTEGFACRR